MGLRYLKSESLGLRVMDPWGWGVRVSRALTSGGRCMSSTAATGPWA